MFQDNVALIIKPKKQSYFKYKCINTLTCTSQS